MTSIINRMCNWFRCCVTVMFQCMADIGIGSISEGQIALDKNQFIESFIFADVGKCSKTFALVRILSNNSTLNDSINTR